MALPLQFYTATVTATQGTRTINAAGKVLVIKESSARFEVLIDGQVRFQIEGGWVLPLGNFSSVTLINLSTSETLTVTLAIADSAPNVPPPFYNYVRFPGTRLVTTSFTLATAASRTFLGLNSGDRRKQFVISNAALDNLELRDASSGVSGATIFPLSNFTLETDADLIVINNQDPNSNIRVSELFYRT